MLACTGRVPLAFIASCCLLVPALAAEPETVRDAARKRGVLIGAAVTPRFLAEPEYQTVLGREFSMVEAENEMKFAYIQPSRGHFRFDAPDALVEFGLAHGMKVRGHTLVWHRFLPKWLEQGGFQQAELRALLREHITAEMKHFAGKVYAWDVVNESFNDDGTLRDSLWYDQPGTGAPGKYGYIEEAFRAAHEADPEALLFYNDYDTELPNAKADAIYGMVKDFKARGVPIDGVGFQCHLELKGIESDLFASNLKRFAALGVQVQITELDVRVPLKESAAPTRQQLEQQARIYGDVTSACLSVKACTAIQLWGFTDRHSWIPGWFKGTGAALPFDADYKPKSAWDTMLQVLARH